MRDLVCFILTIADTTDPTDIQTACATFLLGTVVPSSSQRRGKGKEKPQKNTKQKRKINDRCKGIDKEVYQVDTDDRRRVRIDPGGHQVDIQTITLPRIVGARRREPIKPIWQ